MDFDNNLSIQMQLLSSCRVMSLSMFIYEQTSKRKMENCTKRKDLLIVYFREILVKKWEIKKSMIKKSSFHAKLMRLISLNFKIIENSFLISEYENFEKVKLLFPVHGIS